MKLSDAFKALSQGVRSLGESSLRSVYRTLKRSAAGRMKTFQKHGALDAVPDKIRDMDKPESLSELRQNVGRLSGWLTGKNSTYAGYQRIQSDLVDSFNEKGINISDPEDLRKFGKFMNDMADRFKNVKTYDSDTAVRMWNESKRLGLNAKQFEKNFEFWTEHIEDLESVEPIQRRGGKRNLKPSDYLRQMGIKSMKGRKQK